MINTERLKIGNWVSENGKFIVVNNVWHDRINVSYSCGDYAGGSGWDSETWDKEIEPIPIVPETIKDCGFTKVGDTFCILENGFEINISFNNVSGVTVRIGYNILPCLYIHELQNLYYSLTGKDLDVNWTPWEEEKDDKWSRIFREAALKLETRIKNNKL